MLSLLLIFSCEPNRAENGDFLFGVQNPGETGGNGGGNTTNKLLKKIFTHSLNDDTGQYEDGITSFNYVGNKLVSVDDDSNGGQMKIEYNSSNKISKIFVEGALTSTFEYSGTTLSKITTSITGISNSVTKYTFVNGNMTESVTTSELIFSPIPVKLYTKDTYEYLNNNVTKNTTKIGVYDPVTGELVIDPGSVISVFQYDTKKNPFSLLPKEYNLFFSSIAPQTGFINSVNNPVKTTITEQDGTTTVTNVTYVYDAQDYVKKSSSGDEYSNYEYQ